MFLSSLFSHQFAVNCQHSHWNNAKFAKLEKTMLHSETFKVSNPYTTGGLAQWYSPRLGLWDLKIGSGIQTPWCEVVKALPAVTNELELELTTACRLGPLLCFPKFFIFFQTPIMNIFSSPWVRYQVCFRIFHTMGNG